MKVFDMILPSYCLLVFLRVATPMYSSVRVVTAANWSGLQKGMVALMSKVTIGFGLSIRHFALGSRD